MTDKIKIGGLEFTEKDVGKFVVVEETGSERWLPVGFEAEVLTVNKGTIYVLDTDNEKENPYEICAGGYFKFKWKTQPAPKKQVSKQQRKKLALKVKEAYTSQQEANEAFNLAEEACNQAGMDVALNDDDSIKVSYQPPLEEY